MATLLAIPVLMVVTLLAWGLSSPAGSSPDDDFHLSSIWCGIGERDGLCEASGDEATRMVPAQAADRACFATAPEVSGGCLSDEAGGLAEATWTNANGLYPRLFYATFAPAATADVGSSVLVMRAMNAGIAVVLLTIAFWLLPARLRPALVLSVAATAVPFGLFLIGSTNPSSWAYLSSALVWTCLVGASRTEGRRAIALGVLAVVGAVVGAGARADAAVFAVFAVVLAWLYAGRSGRSRPAMIASAVIVACAAALYLSADQGSALANGLPADTPPLTLGQHLLNFAYVPSVLWGGLLGSGGLGRLGWLDTPLPAMVPLGCGIALGVVLVLGLRGALPRRAGVLALAVAALWIVPFVLQAQTQAPVGYFVQSRYVLPLLVIAVAVATVDAPVARWSGRAAWLGAAALAVAGSAALHANLQRYTVGSGRFALDPGHGREWWWDLPVTPLLVWVVGSIAFALCLGLLVRCAARMVDVSARARLDAARLGAPD